MATSGFVGAPVTKAVLVASVGASVLSQAASAQQRRTSGNPLVGALSREFVLTSPGPLLFSSFLLYTFRVLERQVGPGKYGAFALAVSGLSYALQLGVCKATKLTQASQLPSGPYSLIFAAFVQFFVNVPPSNRFTMMGMRLSDKTFVYLAGLQLLVSGGVPSIVAGAAGLVTGLLYRANFLGLRKLRVPGPISRLLGRTLGPILEAQGPQVIGPGGVAPTAPGARGPGGVAGSGPGRPGRPQAYQQQPPQQQASAPILPPANPEAVQQLMAMGFDREQAARALQATGNDVNAAIALLV